MRPNPNYRPPAVRGSCFPVGVQTVDFAPQSNRTLSYYGNCVKQTSGCTDASCSYKGVNGHPHKECLSDGEYRVRSHGRFALTLIH